MKRSNWVVMMMAAALMAAPAAAQTPPTQPPATAAQPTTPPQGSTAKQISGAEEHLRAASAALNDVPVASLSARAKTQVNELKRRLSALERGGASAPSASATGQAKGTKATTGGVNWGTEVAAMDKVLTSLLGAESATGTTGTTATAGAKGAAAVTLDETSRAKLTEVRTHLTAYAAAMGSGKTDSPTPSATDATATSATGAASTSTEPPASTMGTQPPAGSTASPTSAAPAAAAQPDVEAAKRHLTEARNSLSALTQLPAAAQLAGEARTQISQLITNFNELITTQSNWRDAYAKVNANMTSLLGSDPAPAAASGTAGAVGTSGTTTVSIEPSIREKLTEMRKHLAEFEKVASGGTSTAANPNVEDPPASTTAATGTTGATGTSGTTTTSAEPQRTTAQADWMRHVTAIETMLKSQDESGGLTLDKAKVEMLRTHLAELRKLLERR